MADPILKRFELRLRRALIALLARVARRTRRAGDLSLPPDARILLIRHDRLGDAIVSTAAMKLLRERFPAARIDVLLGPRNRAIAPLLPAVDETLVLGSGIGGLLSIRRRLAPRRYDAVVNLMAKDSASGALLAILAGAGARIGFAGALSTIYDFAILRPEPPTHIVRQTALLLAPFGIAPLADAPRREPEMLELRVAGAPQRMRSLPADGTIRVVVSISAPDDARTWPDANIVALAERPELAGYRWAVAGTPEHRSRVEAIAASSGRIEPLAATPSFAEFVATLADFDVIITPQTSTVHVGSALRCPTLLLNTSSVSDSQWTPWGIPSRVVVCGETLSTIPVAAVADALCSLVEELHRGPSAALAE